MNDVHRQMDAEPVADAASAEPEPTNPVHEVLTICGIATAANRATLINIEGLDCVEAFASMNSDFDITEMVKRMASRPIAAARRLILVTTQITRLQALVYWVKDPDKRGLQAVLEMWAQEVSLAPMARKESNNNHDKVDINITDPCKYQTDACWDNWQIGFVNKLSATMGAAKVLIDYIVCPELDDNNALFFDDDNAWTWIQSFDCTAYGGKAWLAPVAHYDGTGELNKCVKKAKEEISCLHYKNERMLPFEKFVTKLKENFHVFVKR